MIKAHLAILPASEGLFTGKTAGRVLLAASGLLSRIYTTHKAPAAGARAQDHTHAINSRAPIAADETPTFNCPEWPQCGCPGGVTRPECPGLKAKAGTNDQ